MSYAQNMYVVRMNMYVSVFRYTNMYVSYYVHILCVRHVYTTKCTTYQTAPFRVGPSTAASASRQHSVTSDTENKGEGGEVGGWGRDPKKCTGRDWGMGSSTI